MTVWAMLMVEVVHPTVRDMQKESLGPRCRYRSEVDGKGVVYI